MGHASDGPPPEAGRKPRGRHRRPAAAALSPNDLRWWWNRVTKTVLGVGALATAVGAVLALFASHATANSAHFASVQLLSPASLSEFEQRSAMSRYSTAVPRVSRPLLAATELDSPPPDGTEVPPTASPVSPVTSPSTSPVVPSGTTEPPGTASPGPTPSGGSPSTSPSPPVPSATTPTRTSGEIKTTPPPNVSPAEVRAYACAVADRADMGTPGDCDQEVVLAEAMDGRGDALPVKAAARRISGVLGHTRTAIGPHRIAEPVGELVSVDLELIGLKDQPVLLSWSIYQVGGKASLYGNWLHDFAAYRLQASTDDDTGSVLMWVPLPRVPGPYFLRLTLSAYGTSLASDDTGTFK
jgi:hypothetical protein